MEFKKLNIIYFADPMCSTCFGISPMVNKMVDDLQDVVNIQLVMSGLRPYNTETMKELGPFLQKQWNQVEKFSGQSFNCEILSDHSFVYDTEPPCRAVITMRKIAPEFSYPYFKAIQESFYCENKNITKIETLVEIAARFGINEDKFKMEFDSEVLRQATRDDFSFTSKIGVSKFPTIGLKKEEQIIILAKGFAKVDKLIKNVLEHFNVKQS